MFINESGFRLVEPILIVLLRAISVELFVILILKLSCLFAGWIRLFDDVWDVSCVGYAD